MRLKKDFKISRPVLVGIVAAICIVTAFATHLDSSRKIGSNTLIKMSAHISTFTPYICKILDDFTVVNSSVAYSQNILVFQLQNQQDQSIAVTEQLMPESVADNVDPKATRVPGADGSAIITYNGTTTTGALFSTPHHGRQTLVLLNTNAPISQETMQDLLRGLRAETS